MTEQTEVVKVRIPVKIMDAVRKKADRDDRTSAYVIRDVLKTGLLKAKR